MLIDERNLMKTYSRSYISDQKSDFNQIWIHSRWNDSADDVHFVVRWVRIPDTGQTLAANHTGFDFAGFKQIFFDFLTFLLNS